MMQSMPMPARGSSTPYAHGNGTCFHVVSKLCPVIRVIDALRKVSEPEAPFCMSGTETLQCRAGCTSSVSVRLRDYLGRAGDRE
jgi:hypothetical protein